MMGKSNPKSVVLIAGPTASGKSALALNMARELGGVIINADSMQVYRELRVVTARPMLADEAAVPHRLYGHVAAAEAYSVARWQREAMAEIEAALAAGFRPILCGGTGLYFMSLINGISEIPEPLPEVREKWRGFDGDLHAELAGRDPASAARLLPTDRQRLIRALEVFDTTGKGMAQWQAEARKVAPLADFEVRKLFVNLPRAELYARADRRFDAMLKAGALEEVRALPPLPAKQPLMKAIGVPELQAHLCGEVSLDEARVRAQTATRHYIKRQLTWARGQMGDWEQVSGA